MDAIQSFAGLAVGVGTLPLAAVIARGALKALFTFVLEGDNRRRPSIEEMPRAAITVV